VTTDSETKVVSRLAATAEFANAFNGAVAPFAGVGVPIAPLTAEQMALQGFPGAEATAAARATYQNPTAAVESVANSTIQVTEKGLARVESHLDAVLKHEDLPISFQAGERGMLERLRQGNLERQDVEFYMHELKESATFRSTGDLGAAHQRAIQWRGVTERDLFHPDVIKQHPELFNSSWR
jgi:hypothetical protein